MSSKERKVFVFHVLNDLNCCVRKCVLIFIFLGRLNFLAVTSDFYPRISTFLKNSHKSEKMNPENKT